MDATIHVNKRGWYRLTPGLAEATLHPDTDAQTLPVVAIRERYLWTTLDGTRCLPYRTGETVVVVEGSLPRGTVPVAIRLGARTRRGWLTYGRRNVGIFTPSLEA